MKSIRIQIPGYQDFVIGDIWVDVEIEFKPQMHSDNIDHQIAIDAFNSKLHLLAGELQADIKKAINDKLDKI